MTHPEEHDAEERLDEAVERELTEALRCAWDPSDIDPAINDRLIELALEDPLAPPTDEEMVESERLRVALEEGSSHPAADLARALRAATAPGSLEPGDLDRLADEATDAPAPAPRKSGNVVYVAFGAAAAVAALAAAVAIVIRPATDRSEAAAVAAAPATAMAPVAVSRSTAPLFQEKFEVGQNSKRVDRIAVARARDLRSNRYARWGLR